MTTSTSSSQRPLLPSSGRELLLDLKRSCVRTLGEESKSIISPILPTYNSKLVQACFQDLYNSVNELELAIQALDRSNYDQDDDDDDHDNDDVGKGKSNFSMSCRPVLLFHSESIERYKRCLLAYHYQRMEIIKQIQRLNLSSSFSSSTTTIASTTNADAEGAGTVISANQHEVDFARTYAQLRKDYSTKVFELDVPPPISHMVQIRVLQDIGQVVLPENGRSVNMRMGACMFLDRVDVQDFLREGMVQLLDGEEMDF